MLVNLRDFPDGLAAKLKLLTRQRTASGAVLSASQEFVQQRIRIRELEEQVQALQQTVSTQRQTIEQARSAAMHLVEACGQGDMLNG